MQKKSFKPIVRHQTSQWSRFGRGIILVGLWTFVVAVLLANVSFSLGWYSDTLVSLYLLLNLRLHANDHLLVLIGLLLILVPSYCGWRWIQLTKEHRL